MPYLNVHLPNPEKIDLDSDMFSMTNYNIMQIELNGGKFSCFYVRKFNNFKIARNEKI